MSGLESHSKNNIVISGINLFEGGPLSIYYDFLDALIEKKIDSKNNVVAFVHNLSLFKKYENSLIHFVELPKSRKSYVHRLYYEHTYFKKYSKKNSVDYWISLHDITPSVKAKHLYTYCHNPSPFRKISGSDFGTGIKNILFPLFYSLVYKRNIKKTTVIVQQEWLRREFIARYKINKVIVANPNTVVSSNFDLKNNSTNGKKILFFPSFPRTFKNFEALFKAIELINLYEERSDFQLLLTIDGKENKYSEMLFRKYKKVKNVVWLGKLPRDKVFELYKTSDCLVFPSKIETWGLPITEYKSLGKPMILSNEPYAHETLGKYEKVKFFDPNDSKQLKDEIVSFLNGTLVYDGNEEVIHQQPYAKNWNELIDVIFS